MDYSHLRVNAERLRLSLEERAQIGGTPGGGVQRLALTDEDQQARDLFSKWLRQIGCDITVDEMGNIFGRRPGRNNALSPVMSGSHIDSQPKGGRFDGILGVMGALEVMRTLHDNGIQTERPVVIVDWTNEEGSRFSPTMVGSGVWTGALELEWAYDRRDVSGKRLGDELVRIGYKGSAPCTFFPAHCYYEFHIEQGPVLERERKIIGAPKGMVSLLWGDVYITGEGNHAGTTPMDARHDALNAAAEMILRINQLPSRLGGNMVANSRNIIADRVHFSVDFRAWEGDIVLRAWELLCEEGQAIADRNGCPAKFEKTWHVDRSPFDERLVQRVLDVATELGYSNMRWVSGAGHDAGYTNHVCPTGDDLCPEHRRPQPRGGREHALGRLRGGMQCVIALPPARGKRA
jgi:N-carbamoyl-L-amino-acid hydrolase